MQRTQRTQSEISLFNKMNLGEFSKKINTISLHDLQTLKECLDDRYYNTGEETISDDKYDLLTELCKEENQKIKVGHKLRDCDNATKLPYKLNSMDKIKQGDDKKLEKFISRNGLRYIISDKLNGVSCLVCYSKTADIRLYTRGDGDVGADISYFKDNIKGIVKGPTDISVRGELIITKDDFEAHYSRDYKNSLAMLVSVVNSKTLKEPIKHIRFVAYEVVTDKPTNKPSANMRDLAKLGFEVVYNSYLRPNEDPELSKHIRASRVDTALGALLQKRYTASDYSIDGIIVQADVPYDRADVSASGNPNYAIAYKMVTDSCETVVEEVLWAPSRYSILKPRIRIQPVELCGATIEYVTGSNAKFISENKINKGSRVLVIRAGEIIPKIESVITQSKEGMMPDTPYRWNETGVDIISLDDDVSDVTVRRLAFFFSTLGVKQIAEGTIKKLVTHGYDDIFKIMDMSEDDFMKIPTFERKMSQKLRKCLDDIATTHIDITVLMASSGLFGQGIGAKKLKTLMEAIPSLLKTTPTKSDIEKVNGFSDKTATKVLEGIDRFKEFYVKFSKYLTPPEEKFEDLSEDVFEFTKEEIEKTSQINGLSSRLKGEIIVFTNFRDNDVEKKLCNAGAEIGTSVTKKTTCLVVPDGNTSTTGKVAKALQYNVKIMENSAFRLTYRV